MEAKTTITLYVESMHEPVKRLVKAGWTLEAVGAFRQNYFVQDDWAMEDEGVVDGWYEIPVNSFNGLAEWMGRFKGIDMRLHINAKTDAVDVCAAIEKSEIDTTISIDSAIVSKELQSRINNAEKALRGG